MAGSVTAMAAATPTVAPGVHIDPGSPVAKEYAIPLAQARGGDSGGGGSGQLFGSGITRAPSAPATAPATGPTPATGGQAAATPAAPVAVKPKPKHQSGARARAHRRSRSTNHVSQGAEAAAVSGPGPPAAGAGGIAWMLGAAALVLALGGLGGVALSRYTRGAGTRTS